MKIKGQEMMEKQTNHMKGEQNRLHAHLQFIVDVLRLESRSFARSSAEVPRTENFLGKHALDVPSSLDECAAVRPRHAAISPQNL
jgi:hypothetical protein